MFAFGNFTESLIIGYLGNEPALNYLSGSEEKQAICRFRVASNHRVRREGEWIYVTEWHNIVVWHRDAELAARYLKKGSAVCIKGRSESRNYTGNEGQLHTITEVVAAIIILLDRRKNLDTGDATDDKRNAQIETATTVSDSGKAKSAYDFSTSALPQALGQDGEAAPTSDYDAIQAEPSSQPFGVPLPITDPWKVRPTPDVIEQATRLEPSTEEVENVTFEPMSAWQKQRLATLARQKGYTIEGGVMKSKTFQSFGLHHFEDMDQHQAGVIIHLLEEAKPRIGSLTA